MTNYNDGKWHGWNGGECPVHPKTRVSGMEEGGARWVADAEDCDWPSFRGAFRVVKEHREPREFWINKHTSFILHYNPNEPEHYIHVREVKDDV